MFEGISPTGWLVIGCCMALGFGVVRFMIVTSRERAGDDPTPETQRADALEARAWHHVLEVAEDASLETIQDAWRRQMARYHPDRVAGLGPEFAVIAEQRAREINLAYEMARKLRT